MEAVNRFFGGRLNREAMLAALRGYFHRRDLQSQDHLAEDGAFAAERAAVRALWRRLVIEENP